MQCGQSFVFRMFVLLIMATVGIMPFNSARIHNRTSLTQLGRYTPKGSPHGLGNWHLYGDYLSNTTRTTGYTFGS
ncbi:hypothetical protein MAR_033686 [Mya arenaria]|uniref:Secreted protein n=1 Tax=Mya arenaria TaxID=6604 RepID=A0ABY7GCA8_MYAAR|nr:hypothetical protein MAR_033686 [Mya arenaria]